MEFIKVKCRKCGNAIQIPESTVNVICGSCGNVNHYGKISSILKKYSESGEITRPGEFSAEIKGPSYKSIPDQTAVSSEIDIPGGQDEHDFPEEKNASRIITIVFILAPFIAMAIEFFKLPSFAAVVIIILIVVAALAFKK